MGGVPREILYDKMKTITLGRDESDEVQWHPQFLDFVRYWGFRPRLCRPYRAKTKGKVESGALGENPVLGQSNVYGGDSLRRERKRWRYFGPSFR